MVSEAGQLVTLATEYEAEAASAGATGKEIDWWTKVPDDVGVQFSSGTSPPLHPGGRPDHPYSRGGSPPLAVAASRVGRPTSPRVGLEVRTSSGVVATRTDSWAVVPFPIESFTHSSAW